MARVRPAYGDSIDTHPDLRVARIAARQHGVVSVRQLRAVGLGRNAIAGRVEKGRLHRVHRGVYAVGHSPLTVAARWMAAVVACGWGAVLSHLDAALLWRIYDGRGPRIHVTVIGSGARDRSGIFVHRARRLHPDDVTVRDGIPVTTVARTLVDLAGVLPEDRLRRALREAEFQGLLDPAALAAAVARARGRKGLRVLREAVELQTDRGIVRSELEHRFLELARAAGLPVPETNVWVDTRRKSYEVDCLWRAEGVVVELDGRATHARAEAFERDPERDSALSAIGLRPLRYTWRRVEYDGDEVVAELRALLRPQSSTPSRRSTRRRIASDEA